MKSEFMRIGSVLGLGAGVPRKGLAALLVLLATLGCGSETAGAGAPEAAGGFPQQPLTIIVPRGAGGGSHQLSSAMAASLEKILGVEVQVINKPGGDGLDAIEYYRSLPPNGYTILQHVDDIASSFAEGRSSTDPTRDLIPIAIAQITFSQIYIRNLEERFTDWASFVEYVRANPGQVKVAQVGHAGAMEHVLLDILDEALGLKTERLAFNEPSERYLSLVQGQADALIEQPGDVRPFLERNLIKPIITLIDEAPERFADTASLADAGVSMEPLYRFRGFFVHADTPRDRVDRLEKALREAYESPEFQTFNREKYMDLVDSYRSESGARKLLQTTITAYQSLGH